MFDILTRPKVLVWRSDAWQLIHLQDLSPSDTDAKNDVATLVGALENLSKRIVRRCHGLILPDSVAPVLSHQLDPKMPAQLYSLAVHTYAEQSIDLRADERVLSYAASLLEPPLLHYSVLPIDLFRSLKQQSALPIFSEGVVLARSEVRSLRHVAPFAIFQADDLERAECRQAVRRLCFGSLAMILLTVAALQWVKWQPAADHQVFQWPWSKMNYQHQYVNAALRYLRVLPARIRLDSALITAKQVKVVVTGIDSDLDAWHQHWPEQLPPLNLTHVPVKDKEGER